MIFTSYKDDNYSGDINGDGSSSSPSINDWDRIALYDPSSTIFVYDVVKYANMGLYVYNDSDSDYVPTISYNTFAENETGVPLYAFGGSITSVINNNTFTANLYGR